MKNPDTHVACPVYLTTEELGKAFANRGDDEQVEILQWIVKGFDSRYQAEEQACHIGSRMFSEASKRETQDALEFLRMILYSCRQDATKLVTATTDPNENEPGIGR